MNSLGFWIFLSTLLVISYIEYRNGAVSMFFEDATQLEKDKRELQKLKVKYELEIVKKKLGL